MPYLRRGCGHVAIFVRHILEEAEKIHLLLVTAARFRKDACWPLTMATTG